MRVILIGFCLLLLASTAFYGCQSVATTSAKLRNQEGNYDLAIDLSKQALAQNPNDAEAYFQLGVSYSHLDSVRMAYENFQKAIELDPRKEQMANDNIRHNYAKHYNLGQKAFLRSEFTVSAREFKLASLADPREAIGFYNLGVSYARLGEEDPSYYEKAIEALDVVLELATPADKHYVDALKTLGRVLAEVGRVDEAIAKFNRLVEEDPTNYGIIESLGSDRMNSEDWKGAAIFLDLAAQARAKIGADDFNVFYNLGVVNYKLRESDPAAAERAIEYYKKALELNPDEPQTILNMVFAFYGAEDWRNCTQWGERYVKLLPDGERGWQILSIAYKNIGEEDKARQCAIRYEEIMKMKGKTQ
jgi:tetratricopeptide (TPR) repeat protein